MNAKVLPGTQPVSTQARLNVHLQINTRSRNNHNARHALLSRSCSSMHNAAEAARRECAFKNHFPSIINYQRWAIPGVNDKANKIRVCSTITC